jgi:hypothetical protein
MAAALLRSEVHTLTPWRIVCNNSQQARTKQLWDLNAASLLSFLPAVPSNVSDQRLYDGTQQLSCISGSRPGGDARRHASPPDLAIELGAGRPGRPG